MKVYLSGPITGQEVHAKSVFDYWSQELIKKGYEVINPMQLNHNHDKSWLSYMREDIKELMDCDAIFMLDNWEKSKGAKIEYDLAVKLGLLVL